MNMQEPVIPYNSAGKPTCKSLCFSYTANPNTCTVHLINDGVTVNEDTATVEFAGSGPTTTFRCSIDGQGFSPCELVQVK